MKIPVTIAEPSMYIRKARERLSKRLSKQSFPDPKTEENRLADCQNRIRNAQKRHTQEKIPLGKGNILSQPSSVTQKIIDTIQMLFTQ